MASDTPLMKEGAILLGWVSSAVGTLAVGVDEFWMNLRGKPLDCRAAVT